MIDHIGWRSACFVYAALHLLVALPLQMAVVRRQPSSTAATRSANSADTRLDTSPIAHEAAIFALLALVILLYGAGYGISWIGRGTLPLALFGPVRFPRLMGKLAFPSLIVQALAPSAGAMMIEASGPNATIALLTVFALVNAVLIGLLWWLCRVRTSGA